MQFRRRLMGFAALCAAWAGFFSPGIISAADPEQGYRFLTEKPYLPPDFDEENFDKLWTVWPEPLRSEAEKATPEGRRQMAFRRYGLTARPDHAVTGTGLTAPLQYVVSDTGSWTMNCLSCHGGKILGQTVPGLPNNQFALQTLSEELREMRLKEYPGTPLRRMEKASALMPLGTTRGTTNAVTFGILLMTLRDRDLNVRELTSVSPPRVNHHDMDAPPWWHYKKKTHMYADAYAPRGHRGLMQFMLVRDNGPEKFRAWEADFEDVDAYLKSIESPRYPFDINQELAAQGGVLFSKHCAECHGTYGQDASYPNVVVPIDEIGTDNVRYNSIMPQERDLYGRSWFTHYGDEVTKIDTSGYIAPPLDGIWASAPYFHNGSVPTLWHVLHPDQRPAVWRNTDVDGYDQPRVGLVVEEFKRISSKVKDPREQREYFDTRQHGKSAAGHDYPDALTEAEKIAVLEYLKTL